MTMICCCYANKKENQWILYYSRELYRKEKALGKSAENHEVLTILDPQGLKEPEPVTRDQKIAVQSLKMHRLLKLCSI